MILFSQFSKISKNTLSNVETSRSIDPCMNNHVIYNGHLVDMSKDVFILYIYIYIYIYTLTQTTYTQFDVMMGKIC